MPRPAFRMQGSSEILERLFPGGADPRSEAAVRRLVLLVEVADTVTRELSLDRQLPRLIELIAAALDAERATLFLHDAEAGELFSRVAQGEGVTEIRMPASAGISGAVLLSGAAEIVADAYQDPRFNPEIDRRTGYRTSNLVCVPLVNHEGQVIGVTQALNKKGGDFTDADAALLEAINRQAASALQQAQLAERLERLRCEEDEILEVTAAIATELHIDTLLQRIMHAATELLDAERSTLFVYDPAKDELWSRVAEGASQGQIRIPARSGIAGAAFTGGEVLNVPDAYAHPLFNPEVDRESGFHTRNLVAAPVADRFGERLGVVQVLNKRGGPFTAADIRRLNAFSAEIAVAIQNAQLFSDVLALKNYNESVLKSLSNGVVTLDPQLQIVKANEAALRLLQLESDSLMERSAAQVFGNRNDWVTKSLDYVARIGATDYHADTDLVLPDGNSAAVNLTTAPIADLDGKPIGYMLVFEDITREKRVRNTMARYVAREVVDRLLAGSDDVLQGTSLVATVLFSDIRRFATLAEAMGPRDTVAMLNEYFTEMVEVVFAHGGMLDKYMGDALMAIFGAPVTGAADADNALVVANEMIRALRGFNLRRSEAGFDPIEIGIGLATGEVVAGSVGPLKRMEYTVIGDNVNRAARLEGANKYYGTRVLVAGSTVTALKTPTALRKLDLIRIRGTSRPTVVYEALGHHTEATFPNLPRVAALYERGLEAYLARDWAAAGGRFGDALELAPQDRPSRIFFDRCRYYAENPPPEDWNGVWIMEQK